MITAFLCDPIPGKSAMIPHLLICLLPIFPSLVFADHLDSYTPPVYREFYLDVRPLDGQTASIQIILPEAAAQRAFGYTFEFDDTSHRFSDYFSIKSARAYHTRIDQGGEPGTVRIEKSIETPIGHNSTGRLAAFPGSINIPTDGRLAELTLEAKSEARPPNGLQLRIILSVLSNTPPERLWKYLGVTSFSWP